MSAELDQASGDLCAWGAREGTALFVIRTLEDGNVRLVAPQLPGAIVARMLRTAADQLEQQLPAGTMN